MQSLSFRTKRGAFHNCTKNKTKSQRKICSNKDAKIAHFHYFPEMQAGSASMMKVGCCVFSVLEEITNYKSLCKR